MSEDRAALSTLIGRLESGCTLNQDDALAAARQLRAFMVASIVTPPPEREAVLVLEELKDFATQSMSASMFGRSELFQGRVQAFELLADWADIKLAALRTEGEGGQ